MSSSPESRLGRWLASRRGAEYRRLRTPVILQMEATECGAAALGIVLAHFGKWVTLEELRLACGVSRNGSRASNMLLAAEEYGLNPSGYKSSPEALRHIRPPMILHWNFHHFVVLEGFRGDRVYLNDPSVGRIVVSAKELHESFTGVVLTFAPRDLVKSGRRPSLVPGLSAWLRGSWAAVAFVFLAGAAAMAPQMLAPVFPKLFVDRVLLGAGDRWLTPLLIAMFAIITFLGAALFLQKRSLLRLETRLAVSGSRRLFWHVLRLPVEFFSQRYAGDISSRMPLPNKVADLLSRHLVPNLLNVLLALLVVAIMASYDLQLTAVGVAAAALNVLALRYFSRRRADGNRRLQQEKGLLQGALMGGLELIETVKALGAESDLFERWAGYQTKVVNLRQHIERYTQLLEVVPALLVVLTTTSILWLGSIRVMEGDLTLGELVAFQALMAVFLMPVSRLVSLGGRLQIVEADLMRLDDIQRHPVDSALVQQSPPARAGAPLEDPDDPQDAGDRQDRRAAVTPLRGAIEMAHVDFGYDRSSPPFIEDFCLRVEPGSCVAIVGASGSGKSTIARLLCALYRPWQGELRFDDVLVGDLPRQRLLASLASVDQTVTLFAGTLRDNLTLWDNSITLEAIEAAARDAEIFDEIMARPSGFDSVVEDDGRNWSGGQRQRLELARALAREPSILVLDEATAALDPETERRIGRNLERRGCTRIVVAHRLSTVRSAEEILVMEHGRVVERGHHLELLERRGVYSGLVSAF